MKHYLLLSRSSLELPSAATQNHMDIKKMITIEDFGL